MFNYCEMLSCFVPISGKQENTERFENNSGKKVQVKMWDANLSLDVFVTAILLLSKMPITVPKIK